ncbi:MAG: Rieske 2Fe-2S domain-containing protein [Proteobacteria bacterium]|nr:Rieske 2Fe-2S domain-containing protein [Pseudomonadota bacterium]
MLSKKNNELLTRVGPGTVMGSLLRRFWMPGFFEEEVAKPDDPPVRLRLLGEDLVAFKDSDGRIGVIEEHCHHRRASLYFGRNEECGLRCVYHGWKFDVDGNCVDMPSEPNPSKTLMAKAKLISYPTCVRGGVVWIYMGPAELCPPSPPMFEWSYLDRGHHAATKRLQQCNWAQAVEGGIDSSHISFLHANLGDAGVSNFNRKRDKYAIQDRHPEFFISDTDYGMTIAARRNGEADSYYWRITQFLMPFYR